MDGRIDVYIIGGHFSCIMFMNELSNKVFTLCSKQLTFLLFVCIQNSMKSSLIHNAQHCWIKFYIYVFFMDCKWGYCQILQKQRVTVIFFPSIYFQIVWNVDAITKVSDMKWGRATYLYFMQSKDCWSFFSNLLNPKNEIITNRLCYIFDWRSLWILIMLLSTSSNASIIGGSNDISTSTASSVIPEVQTAFSVVYVRPSGNVYRMPVN